MVEPPLTIGVVAGEASGDLLGAHLIKSVRARLPRARFIAITYRFFLLNLLIFAVLLYAAPAAQHVWIGRVFFIWTSIFNLFVVSVFWALVVDVFDAEQGKRLFGFIAAGGSLGALLGPALIVGLAIPLGPVNLLIIAALLIEAAVFCALRLEAAGPRLKTEAAPVAAPERRPDAAAIGGGWLAGITLLARSPYLAGIALWVALLSLAGTFLYFQQATIVAAASDDPAVRTRIFATIDLAIGILTILVQLAATGRLIKRFGAGPAAAFLPAVFCLGFLALALAPALWVVIAFQAAQRAANFAISNPARELLFTVVGREEKYKAKNVIDLVVFRGGDAVSGWLFAALRGAGLEPGGISLATVPVTAAWLALALALGRVHERRAARS